MVVLIRDLMSVIDKQHFFDRFLLERIDRLMVMVATV